MGRHRLEGKPPIDVILRRSARARRFSLRVSRLDGRVTLTMPQNAPQAEGVAFIRSREKWLRQHLSDLAPAQRVGCDVSIPVRGQDKQVITQNQGAVCLSGAALLVKAHAPVAPQVKAFLREEARRDLTAASDKYAAALGRTYAGLTLRDTRSRWGSCTSAGRLMYSWRLIMAPPAVLEYVAAHEVAHLVQMNHSRAFWDVVAELCPDFTRHRAWLREKGETLHRFRFED